MTAQVLLDTGPLVALLHRKDRDHAWATEALARLPAPARVSEPVLAEACFLLRKVPGGAEAVLSMLESGALEVGLQVSEEVAPLRRLMEKYRDVPMSLADATLVRMAELTSNAVVVTLDSDFRTYRAHRRRMISVIAPERGR